MSYLPGEIHNPTFGNDLGIQWAELMSNPYHVSSRPSVMEAVHYLAVADAMRLTFDPAEAPKVAAEYIEAGRGDELDFISKIVEIDTIAIAAHVSAELSQLHSPPAPDARDEPTTPLERIEQIVADHKDDELPAEEMIIELDEAAIEAAVFNGMKVAYFIAKQGFAA